MALSFKNVINFKNKGSSSGIRELEAADKNEVDVGSIQKGKRTESDKNKWKNRTLSLLYGICMRKKIRKKENIHLINVFGLFNRKYKTKEL